MGTTFVVGATGYIGGALAERLASEGQTVVGLAHTPRAEQELLSHGHTPVRATLADIDVLQQAASEADAVVWTVMSLNIPDYPGMEVAVKGINDALAGSGKPFLCMGGGIVYADTGDSPVAEDGALDLSNPIAEHAMRIEEIALSGATRGIRSMGIRSSLVYGRGAGMFMRGPIEWAREVGEARYVGSGAMKMSTVHVDDLVDLLVRALRDAPPGSVFNAAADQPVTTLELARGTAGAAGIEKVTSVPIEKAYEVLGFLGSVMAKNLWLSVERARELLGWQAQQPPVLQDLATGSYAGG
jgi:nucleoside-diphosphate-sugar epimerase